MDRRRFLKSAAGLFIPAAPALILPKLVRAQGGMGPGPGMVHSTGGGLGLQTSCTGFWSLENSSWTDDTASGTTLTGTASPTNPAGIVGNGVGLDGSTQFLSAASNANILNGGGSFSAQCWVNIPSPGAGFTGVKLFSKANAAFAQDEWGFGGGTFWTFVVWNTSSSSFTCTSAVTLASGWHHLVGTLNSSTGAALIYVDGSVSGSGATLTGTMNSSASAPLNIGRIPGGILPVAATIDQCAFWKGRVLSAGDVTLLYNSGAGLSWAAMA